MLKIKKQFNRQDARDPIDDLIDWQLRSLWNENKYYTHTSDTEDSMEQTYCSYEYEPGEQYANHYRSKIKKVKNLESCFVLTLDYKYYSTNWRKFFRPRNHALT